MTAVWVSPTMKTFNDPEMTSSQLPISILYSFIIHPVHQTSSLLSSLSTTFSPKSEWRWRFYGAVRKVLCQQSFKFLLKEHKIHVVRITSSAMFDFRDEIKREEIVLWKTAFLGKNFKQYWQKSVWLILLVWF